MRSLRHRPLWRHAMDAVARWPGVCLALVCLLIYLLLRVRAAEAAWRRKKLAQRALLEQRLREGKQRD